MGEQRGIRDMNEQLVKTKRRREAKCTLAYLWHVAVLLVSLLAVVGCTAGKRQEQAGEARREQSSIHFEEMEKTLRELMAKKRQEWINPLAAPHLCQKDLFQGPKRQHGPSVWVLGRWQVEGTPATCVARATHELGTSGGVTAEEVIEVTLRWDETHYTITDARAYHAELTHESNAP